MRSSALPRLRSIIFLCLCFLVGVNAQADEKLKPYVMAANAPGDHAAVLADTRRKLEKAGFDIIGEYSPYQGASIIAVTNAELKTTAAKTDMGGFGAVQRVSITTVDGNVQVAHTNPRYMAHVYRMAGDLAGVAAKFEAALGAQETFGAAGRSADELRNYHYKMFMPYFDEPWTLKEFPSQGEAVREIESNLANGVGGASRVYRLDIPGQDETVIGVGLTEGCGGDQFIMQTITSAAELKATPHLPYEVLISGGKVRALHAKFRIAQSFPDLTMLGTGSFWDIRCAPDAIQGALNLAVGNPARATNAWQ